MSEKVSPRKSDSQKAAGESGKRITMHYLFFENLRYSLQLECIMTNYNIDLEESDVYKKNTNITP
jgi:hypothetical protein